MGERNKIKFNKDKCNCLHWVQMVNDSSSGNSAPFENPLGNFWFSMSHQQNMAASMDIQDRAWAGHIREGSGKEDIAK